jgi:undecaprenyl-diphosphatase
MSNLLQAAALGAVQGLTEFLPVSSTAHLILVQRLLGLNSAAYGLSFDMATNLGTTVALVAVFWTRLRQLFAPSTLLKPRTHEHNLARWILLVTIPVAIAGLFSEKLVEGPLRSPWVIVAGLVAGSALIYLAEQRARKHATDKPSATQVAAMGMAQILAFVPGMSRSGSTMSVGMLSGLTRQQVAELTFMLSVPINLLAIAKRLLDFTKLVLAGSVSSELVGFYIVGGVVAGIVGWISLRWLLQFITHYSLNWFALYRVLLAAIVATILIITR